MQKKKQKNTTKQIILFILLFILVLLIIFAEDIKKLTQKNQIDLAENSENELVTNEPNIPQLSAGMIPVKWDGTNWIITTSTDKDWYDYSNGKPAYIMLNDGTYQSELIRDMTGKKLVSDVVGNDAPVVPNENDTLGTIFMWIPRYAVNASEEIAYIKEEITPGGEWIVPDLFMYKVADETKPDFSLSGVWIQKDVDTSFSTKIAQMNQEESVYGFIANTKPKQITSTDINTIQNYINILTANIVGNDALVVPINNQTNPNRIILKIVNTSKYEPIKANITQNIAEGRLEIRVTYTANGIREIIDEYGDKLELTNHEGITIAKTKYALASGTHTFTIVDNRENKQELNITISVDSLFKVAYINGIDNMDNTTTYTKTQESNTTEENTLLNQIKLTDTTKTFNKAIQNDNVVTAIGEQMRTSNDEIEYIYNKYYAIKNTEYNVTKSNTAKTSFSSSSNQYLFSNYSIGTDGTVTLTGSKSIGKGVSGYSFSTTGISYKNNTKVTTTFYYVECYSIQTWTNSSSIGYNCRYYDMTANPIAITYSRGNYIEDIIEKDGVYENNKEDSTKKYWYVKTALAPKYTLHKYTSDLTLLSTYDVDTATLTTVPIDISNKGRNKLKLTLTASGSDYKTYISNDNTNWQEVIDVTSGTPKELNVDGWNNLYIKIEANTSTIKNIDIAYYKD